ncbi:hypothetical protein HZA75_05595 [Candidatus Roizmanbacteria bacterium]|nr:hypothetical protein [Candidatus Roizmanbacteria bacterium]
MAEKSQQKDKNWKRMNRGGSTGAVYGLGFIGAAFYFIQHGGSFWLIIYGLLKAIVWPALIVYKALDFFKM